MKLWHLLRGTLLEPHRPDNALTCPACHAPVQSPRISVVEWDASHTRFPILQRADCLACRHPVPVFVKMIPLVITPRATCSCGSLLTLHSATMQANADEWTHTAVYSCCACKRSKRVVAHKLKRLLTKRWQVITHLRVDPAGLHEITADGDEEPYVSRLTPPLVGMGGRA